MPGYCGEGRRLAARVQARRRRIRHAFVALAAAWLLTGCSDPLSGPVDLYHDLEGGEIAAQRPPPPGAGLPYPKLGTVPAKPALPDPAYRNGLQAQLQAERDRTERLAADAPVAALVPPPPPPPPALPPPDPVSLPDVPAAPGQATTAAATLDTAEAPRAKPADLQAAAPIDFGPAPGAKLTITGAPVAMEGVPDLPAAPPPPATFEGVPAEPVPTPHVLPAGLAGSPAGTQVFFADNSAVLPVSQNQALRDFLSHRRHQTIVITGLGEAASDTPDGQATAVALGLKRAQAVAYALSALHVPQGAMRVGANAFGRGAVLSLSF